MKKTLVILLSLVFILALASCNRKKIEDLTNSISANTAETDSPLEIIVPELKHGRAILFKLPTEEFILADCGTARDFPDLFELLRKNNVEFIDHIILTSDTQSCIGGLDKLLANFSVGEIHVSELVKDKDTYLPLCKMSAAEDAWLKLECEGSRIYDFDSVCFDVVSSFNCVGEQGNSSVMSIYITHKDKHFLLEGDGNYWAETEMVATMPYDLYADVLFAANCGSGESSDSTFLQTVCPTHAIIPVYGGKEVSNTVLKAMKVCDIKVLRTDHSGQIKVVSNGDKYLVEESR